MRGMGEKRGEAREGGRGEGEEDSRAFPQFQIYHYTIGGSKSPCEYVSHSAFVMCRSESCSNLQLLSRDVLP